MIPKLRFNHNQKREEMLPKTHRARKLWFTDTQS
jgi:hypothetical protein